MRSLDNDTPGENDGKRVTSTRDVVYDGCREQTELNKARKSVSKQRVCGGEETDRVKNEVINEPRSGNSSESNPVAFDDEPVGDLGVFHRIAFVPLRFVHIYSPNQDRESREDAKAKGETPDGPKVVRTEAKIKV